MKTVDAFQEAAKIRPEAAEYWLQKLGGISLVEYTSILNEIPDTEISTPARNFTIRMLEINTARILKDNS